MGLKWLVALVVCAMGMAGPVMGQGAAPIGGGAGGIGVGGAGGVGTGEVQVTASWFGVGGVARPGEWTGIRLSIRDSADRQREVLVRVSVPDADGDVAQYESVLTTNPGVDQQHWVYVMLPVRLRAQDVVQAQVFAAIDRPGVEAGRSGVVAGRLLGAGRLQPRQVLSRGDGLIGVVGSRPMGLTRYSGIPGVIGLPGSHERSELVLRLDADALPDRWLGLSGYEVVVWNEGSPASLGSARAAAMREWVERGGHLVVVLPRVGQTWTDPVNNPLHEITPRVRVERREGVSLDGLGLLVTRRSGSGPDGAAMPSGEVLQVMRPEVGASESEALAVLTTPGGEWLVARRLVGVGAVTLVGLDASSRWMTERGLPEPEMFWHRVLGRRGELSQVREADGTLVRLAEREPITLDRDIGDQIAKTGRAEVGVLVGLVLFVGYWLVAGPAGYALLRRYGQVKHSWVWFLGSAGVFTALAWGGAAALRPQRVDASHLTIVDHVYGQPVQRARSWLSLLVPTYGTAVVSLSDATGDGADGRWVNAMGPWEAEGQPAASFPDARGYRVDAKRPDEMAIPTRATVKQLQVDWAGGPRWRMPRPVGPDPATARLELASAAGERSRGVRTDTMQVRGSLVHDLPGELRDVVVIVNRGQRHLASALGSGGPLLADVSAYKLASPWPPGQALDLSRVTAGPVDTEYFSSLLASEVGSPDGGTLLDAERGRVSSRLTAIGLLHQLQPPEVRQEALGRRERLARRVSTHGFDLSVWFTQPSVIVIGHIGERDSGPGTLVPLSVSTGGAMRAVGTSGRTVVRWVYPLPADPPRFPAVGEGAGGGG